MGHTGRVRVSAGDLGIRGRNPSLFRGLYKGDGVSASKNWKTDVFPFPPEWNEYIPKKNRHSESVHHGGEAWGNLADLWGKSPTEGLPFFSQKLAKLGQKSKPFDGDKPRNEEMKNSKKRTAPSVPKWSPTSVLTGPDQA